MLVSEAMDAALSSDPKRRTVDHLKRNGESSTSSVAKALGISDVAARQHLASLEARGLVASATARPEGKGRPAVIWRLTPLANQLFPDRHDSLAVDLIDAVRVALGEEALQQVLAVRAERQLAALRKQVPKGAPLAERLNALARQRSREGYMAEVAAGDDGSLLLTEHHCPINQAAEACRAFCGSELELFVEVLGPDVDIRREEHLLSGGNRCVYRVSGP